MSAPTILFVGDSVTDCERRTDPEGLGDGYVRLLAAHPQLEGMTVINRGISGNRVRDLRARWEADVVAERPDVISILVGVNDMWRRYDENDPTTPEEFGRDYRALLDSAAGARLVLVEPFLLPVSVEQETWREDLDEKRRVVRALAAEYGAVLVPADAVLNGLADAAGLAPDGVHPSTAGHEELARLWLWHASPVLDQVRRNVPAAPADGAV